MQAVSFVVRSAHPTYSRPYIAYRPKRCPRPVYVQAVSEKKHLEKLPCGYIYSSYKCLYMSN